MRPVMQMKEPEMKYPIHTLRPQLNQYEAAYANRAVRLPEP